MNFFEAFENIKKSITKFDSAKFENDFAIQVTMTNKDCGGIFYIEYKDGQLNIEPYNYYDNNVDITSGYADLLKVLSGKLALTSVKLNITGDAEILASFISSIEFKTEEKPKAPAKKCGTKKCATKKAEEKPAEKPVKKETVKAAAAETIAKTVVNEVKPKKACKSKCGTKKSEK